MPDPFQHIEWKLWRVRTHTEEIGRILEDFLTSQFYELVPEMDDEGRFVLRFGTVQPIPETVSIMVGEAAHHLRSILDHIAFSFCRPTTQSEERAIQFPIVNNKEAFDAHIKRGGLIGANQSVIDLIESTQPYDKHRSDKGRCLSRIQSVNNIDKHRKAAFSISTFSTTSVNIEIINGDGKIIDNELFEGRAETGTIVARFKPTGYWTAGTEVRPNPTFKFFPVFDESMPENIAGLHPLNVISEAGTLINYQLLPMFRMLI